MVEAGTADERDGLALTKQIVDDDIDVALLR